MSLIISGQKYELDGLKTVNWQEDPRFRLKLPEDGRIRPKDGDIRAIVLHSTKGYPSHGHPDPQTIRYGYGVGAEALRTIRYWTGNDGQAGAHLIVDSDAVIFQTADLRDEMTYHAGDVNKHTIGVEIFQQPDASFYAEQLTAAAKLCRFLCEHFGLPFEAQYPYAGRARADIGRCRGVYGHRDCSDNRGFGDPGDLIFQYLKEEGFDLLHLPV